MILASATAAGSARYTRAIGRCRALATGNTYAPAVLRVPCSTRNIYDEPSEELLALEGFPNILRGSLFVYVVAAFENLTRTYVNAKFGTSVITKAANLNAIAAALASSLPKTIDAPTAAQLGHYKHLRDACAHTGGDVSSELHELFKVSATAGKVPGVVLCSPVEPGVASSTFTRKQLAVGALGLSSEFVPAAIAFFSKQFARVTG